MEASGSKYILSEASVGVPMGVSSLWNLCKLEDWFHYFHGKFHHYFHGKFNHDFHGKLKFHQFFHASLNFHHSLHEILVFHYFLHRSFHLLPCKCCSGSLHEQNSNDAQDQKHTMNHSAGTNDGHRLCLLHHPALSLMGTKARD